MLILAITTTTTACEHRSPPNTAVSARPTTAPTGAAATQNNSLVLGGKAFPLHDVRCGSLGGAVLVTAKTPSDEKVIVDAAGDKLETLDFTADGVGYFWEPTSTGGAPTPVLVRAGGTYTVTGEIKQLHDFTKFSEFTFRATCPE
ncbi:hypothetical protein BST20_26185 [Mycobacterium branderi]|nr:hypothetical protein BST20_26185 [Mycobacterium branderi]